MAQLSVSTDGVVKMLRSNLLDRYRDCFCIVQELLQNADDAKAKRIHFGICEGLKTDHPLGKLRALYIVNDGPVTQSDMGAIFSMGASNKDGDKEKIGKFGLGMKSVFHVCEGFFMFGGGESHGVMFPESCTPWDDVFPPGWGSRFDGAKEAMAEEVEQKLGDVVQDWKRWFCVWLPLREKGMLGQVEPIIQTYPTEREIDEVTGKESAQRAGEMLPLLRNLEEVSFRDRHGAMRSFRLESEGRIRGGDR